MRICIFGAGAIGGYLAAGLAEVEGVEVSLIARGPHLAAIKEKGLTLVTADATRTVRCRASSEPAELGPQDYVIVALKAHQAWEAAERLRPLLGPDTAVVTCQNGVPWWYFHRLSGPYEGTTLEAVDRDRRQWRGIGPERAVGCVVYPATEIAEPGTIRHVYGDKFSLGEPDGTRSDRALRLSEALEKGGFRAPVLDDIRSEIWLKLWGNLTFNPISGLSHATLADICQFPLSRELAADMMREASEVAGRLGIRFRVTLDKRIEGAEKVGRHKTSMLQDIEAGRPPEIEALVGAVIELGRLTQTPTPHISTVYALIRLLARTMENERANVRLHALAA